MREQLSVVASHFHTQSIEAIRAWRGLQSQAADAPKPKSTAVTPSGPSVAGQAGHITTIRVVTAVRQAWQVDTDCHVNIVTALAQYALLNAAALQHILQQHDRKLTSRRGQRYLESLQHGQYADQVLDDFTRKAVVQPSSQGSFLYAPHHEELKAILLINHLQQTARNNATPSTTGMARPTAAELAAVDPNSTVPSRGVLMRTYLAIFGPWWTTRCSRASATRSWNPSKSVKSARYVE